MTEREQFEEWVKANWPDSVSLGMNIDGRYRYNHANALFELWKQLRLQEKESLKREKKAWWWGWCSGVISMYFAIALVGRLLG